MATHHSYISTGSVSEKLSKMLGNSGKQAVEEYIYPLKYLQIAENCIKVVAYGELNNRNWYFTIVTESAKINHVSA